MELLLRAASRIGSSQRLATFLHVSHDELRAWMRGDGTPPAQLLERVQNLLAERAPQPGTPER
jgi:DNA-binding transcriptional regulator YiaG